MLKTSIELQRLTTVLCDFLTKNYTLCFPLILFLILQIFINVHLLILFFLYGTMDNIKQNVAIGCIFPKLA